MAEYIKRACVATCFAMLALATAATALAGAAGAAYAAVSSVRTAQAVPLYANPVSGAIEDVAGTSNVALAESMVTGCTYPSALVEQDATGATYVTLRFKLADQIGQMQFWADNGDGAFAQAASEQMQTDAVSNTVDYRIEVPSAEANIRVSMFVTPMGRDVVYFVRLANSVEGNTDAMPFVQSIVPGEELEDSEASDTTAAAGVDVAAEDGSSDVAGDAVDPAPSESGAANGGVREFNADGQEVTSEQNAAPAANGGVAATVVVAAVAVAAVAGAVSYMAYFRPRNARRREAAAAAAAGASVAEADAAAVAAADEAAGRQ